MYQTFITFLMICFITISSSFSATFTFHQALEIFYKKSKPTMPQAESDGRTPTLNKKGAISPTLDYATLAFLDFAKNKRVLEIGGAYGNVMLEALRRNSSTIYHLNDLDERHLGIAAFRLQEKIDQRQICVAGLGNVQFIYGDITQTSWKVDKPYEAVLMTNVMRFLTPKEIEQTLKSLFNSLESGGRIFISATTPYVNRYKSFIPEYLRRIKDATPHPGFVKNISEYETKENNNLTQLGSTPEGHFMFLDDVILSRLCTAAGFRVIACTLKPLCYTSEMWELDGRETVIFIGEKP